MSHRRDVERAAILVTGSHRSGTTWTGRMLSASPTVGLIMEPFSPIHHRPGICGVRFDRWFPYLRPHEGQALVPEVARMLRFEYRLSTGVVSSRSPRDIGRLGRDALYFRRYRARAARPLLKDPNALFLTPWLASNFNLTPVVLIRHPAAFISSLRALGWGFSFDNLLRQPDLMEDHLGAFERELSGRAGASSDPIGDGILLWRVLHAVIADWREAHPDWVFARHEDLSRDPEAQIAALCGRLRLPFDARIRQRIDEFCGAGNPADVTGPSMVPQRASAIRRHSAANISNWKRRLPASDIARIRDGVADLSARFYDDEDW
jgi:hypothetical protein